MASVVPAKRPASVTVLAVLQIVVGVVGLVAEGCEIGVALAAANSPSVQKAVAAADPATAVRADVPFYFQANLAASAAGLVLSLVLIADGVGLLRLRRWAYNLGVLYGWLSIVYQAAWLAYVLLVAQPVILEGLSNIPIKAGTLPAGTEPQAYRSSLQVMQVASTVGTAVGLIYPIFVLIMLAATRKAFRRPKGAPEGAVPAAAPLPADRVGQAPS